MTEINPPLRLASLSSPLVGRPGRPSTKAKQQLGVEGGGVVRDGERAVQEVRLLGGRVVREQQVVDVAQRGRAVVEVVHHEAVLGDWAGVREGIGGRGGGVRGRRHARHGRPAQAESRLANLVRRRGHGRGGGRLVVQAGRLGAA